MGFLIVYFKTSTSIVRSCSITNIDVTSGYESGLEAAAHKCSSKKVFLVISQNSQEKICTRIH